MMELSHCNEKHFDTKKGKGDQGRRGQLEGRRKLRGKGELWGNCSLKWNVFLGGRLCFLVTSISRSSQIFFLSRGVE